MTIPFPIRAIPHLTFEAWLTPPPLPTGARERDIRAVNDLAEIRIGELSGFEVGTGPLVLAIHGWGGRAAQLAPVARRLAEDGFRVVALDLPGRAGGAKTDIKQVAAALHDVIEQVGWPDVVIAHSFASLVLRLAFPDQAPPVVVLVAPALRVTDAVAVFGNRLRLLPRARRGLRKRLERWDPDLWPTVAGLYPEQLPGAQMLIVHDPDDEDTPFIRSAELAAIRPHTEIAALEGAGHNRILADATALDLISEFLNQRVGGASPAGSPVTRAPERLV